MKRVLVTGGSGYLSAHLIAALLRAGRPVRTTVRSLDREPELRAAVRRGAADDSGLEVVTADLLSDDGWKAAVDRTARKSTMSPRRSRPRCRRTPRS